MVSELHSVLCWVTQSRLTLCNPADCSLPGSSVHGILQARILEWVAMPSSRGSSTGIEPRSPALQADSSQAEPPGKPKDTGVHSLCHLQRIFPTRELNWCLLHCRQILYQLSYQGSLNYTLSAVNFLNMAALGSGQGKVPSDKATEQDPRPLQQWSFPEETASVLGNWVIFQAKPPNRIKENSLLGVWIKQSGIIVTQNQIISTIFCNVFEKR